ncbi:MAG: ABC transporter ATP-binding protein [Candidatus Atribacteria bacterium]|nr:ABC transporter ATP-binding protein [Candidatus Atribacteria bacterium]
MVEVKQARLSAFPGTGPTRGPLGGFGPGPHFSGTGPASKPKNARATLQKLWRYLKNHQIKLIIVFFLVFATSLLALIGPYLIGKAIDEYIVPKNISGLLPLILVMIVLYVVISFLTWIQNNLMITVAQQTVLDMRRDLFQTLQKLPIRFFDKNLHGDVMSRLTNDIDQVNTALSTSLTQIFSSVITLAGTVVIMLWLNPILTMAGMIIIPVMLFSTKRIANRTRKHFLEQQTILGQLNGLIEENISGQKVIKVFSREKEEINRFEKVNHELNGVSIRAQIFSGIIMPLMNALNNLSFALLAIFGGLLVIRQMTTVGIIASFVAYSKQFTRPLNELANQFNMIQSAISSAERVFEVMSEIPEPLDPPDAIALQEIKGEVEFMNVSFEYNQGEPVLKNVSFHAKPGQTIAIVGPTGAGKTSIVNLLTRFYDVDNGSILIDGIDIRKIKRSTLRSLLGIVLQDTYLFAESIRENIQYGRLNATNTEVDTAAKLANAEQFIRHLPQGYDTILSEDGGDLSQGQRQLLAIARAILADPTILILDEATSSIDTRTEQSIQQAMLHLMKGRTCFVIAHRLNTIRNADVIMVVNEGQIIESGNHEQLLKQSGFYFDLYMSQFNQGLPPAAFP